MRTFKSTEYVVVPISFVIISAFILCNFYVVSASASIPIEAIAFQDQEDYLGNPVPTTFTASVLSAVSSLDNRWSPADIIPIGTVTHDYIATGKSPAYFDAISLKFSTENQDLHNLVLRAYLQKGNYCEGGYPCDEWEHYQILSGVFNTQNEDSTPENAVNNTDHYPGGYLPCNTVVGWIEIPFDATSDPTYIQTDGTIGVTLRLWNWRVDAIELISRIPQNGFLVGPFVPRTGKWKTVPNGGFESGDLTGWTLENPGSKGYFSVSSEMSFNGKNSVKAIPQISFNGWGFNVHQYIPVIPGTTYVLSGFFNRHATGSLYLDLGDVSFEKEVDAQFPYLDEWQFAWNSFTVPSGVSQVRLRLCHDGQVVVGEYGYIDEVAITPISEFVPPKTQQGMLYGNVFDGVTGKPLGSVTVVAGNYFTKQTNDQGYFVVNGVHPGLISLSFEKDAYYPVTKLINVTEDSCTVVNISMTPVMSGSVPTVVSVRSKYTDPSKANKTYYLSGISIEDTFIATIDWKGQTPGKVTWFTPTHTIETPCSGTTASQSFDVGSDFGSEGGLRIVAVADGGIAQSAEYMANMEVIPQPPIMDLIPSVTYVALPDLDTLEYKILGLESVKIKIFEWDDKRIPENVPFFGKQKMVVGAELDLSGKVRGDGTAELFSFEIDAKTKKVIRKGVPCRKGMKLPFVELGPKFGLDAGMTYFPNLSDPAWKPTGSVELGIKAEGSGPQVPLSMLTGIPLLHFLYVRGDYAIDLTLNGSIKDWDLTGPQYDVAFSFEPLVKAVLSGFHTTNLPLGYGASLDN